MTKEKAKEPSRQNQMDFKRTWKEKIKSRDLLGAIALCQKEIDKNPKEAPGYFARGLSKFYLGNHQGAINDYSKAIERGLNTSEAYLARARSKKSLEDVKGSCEDWNEAANLGNEKAAKLFKEHDCKILLAKSRSYSSGKNKILAIYDINELRIISDRGCSSSVASNHLSYEETIEFFDEYEDEIKECLLRLDQSLQTYHSANNKDFEQGFKKDMTWSFIEAIAGIECGIDKESIKAKIRKHFKEEEEEETYIGVDEIDEYKQ